MTEPVTLDQVKAYLRLDSSVTDQDDWLTGSIIAARRLCEKHINQSVQGTAKVLVLDGFPRVTDPTLPFSRRRAKLAIPLLGGTVATVSSIAYTDDTGTTITLDDSQWQLDTSVMPARLAPAPGNVWPDGEWPQTGNDFASVTISYTVSPLAADDLAIVVQAMLMLIARWENQREAGVDVRGTPAEIPFGVTILLDAIRSYARD